MAQRILLFLLIGSLSCGMPAPIQDSARGTAPVQASDPASDPTSPGEPSQQAIQVVAAGHRVTVRSRILSEDRELLVYLPESYESGSSRYPVLYLLDAESDFLHTVGIVEFLGGIDRIPQTIVVGIVNTNRSRDLTPVSTDADETAFWDETGGADRFQQVMQEEIVPFVDRTYRTEPFRILRGQSFGGLFAIHDYLSGKPVFDAVIASSPAVGWNHGVLQGQVPDFFSAGVPRPLYIASAGKDFPGTLASIRKFVGLVEETPADPQLWRHDHFESDGHYSLHHQSTYRGLEFLFEAWSVPDEIAAAANFEAYEEHFAALSERYGYRIRIPMRSVVRIGNQLLREQAFEKGISVFERALILYADLPEAHWRVGEAYRLAGRLGEARPHFQRAFDLATEQDVPDLEDYRRTLESF